MNETVSNRGNTPPTLSHDLERYIRKTLRDRNSTLRHVSCMPGSLHQLVAFCNALRDGQPTRWCARNRVSSCAVRDIWGAFTLLCLDFRGGCLEVPLGAYRRSQPQICMLGRWACSPWASPVQTRPKLMCIRAGACGAPWVSMPRREPRLCRPTPGAPAQASPTQPTICMHLHVHLRRRLDKAR